jgi:hypothetical protein
VDRVNENPVLITAVIVIGIVIIGLAVLVIRNYRRDDLPSRPTKEYMSDDEWDGK